MQYEYDNRTKPGMMSHVTGIIKRAPDTYMAAKSGSPAMTSNRPTVPVSVPSGNRPTVGTSDVTVQTVADPTLLDNKPDARQNPPAAGSDVAAKPVAAATTPTDTANQPLPSNRQPIKSKKEKTKPATDAKPQPVDAAASSDAQTPTEAKPAGDSQ